MKGGERETTTKIKGRTKLLKIDEHNMKKKTKNKEQVLHKTKFIIQFFFLPPRLLQLLQRVGYILLFFFSS